MAAADAGAAALEAWRAGDGARRDSRRTGATDGAGGRTAGGGALGSISLT